MKKCSACGFPLPDVAKYCYSCGSKLSQSVGSANEKIQRQRKKDDSSKGRESKVKSCAKTSSKKRWKFVFLGVLLGFFGAHLAYARRWLLFLLLWSGFICGNVMDDKTPDGPTEVCEQVQEVPMIGKTNNTEKEVSNPISNAGFAVWVLLWIGGTLFIKKDGNGCRM